MVKSEIEQVVETLLKDKLDQIWQKIMSLEQKLQSLEKELTQQQCDICKNNNIQNNQISSLENTFQNLNKQLQIALEAANQVVEKSEKKILETKKVKMFQQQKMEKLNDNSFKSLLMFQNQQYQQLQQQQQQQQQQFQQKQQNNEYKIQNQQQQVPVGMIFCTQNGQKYHSLYCDSIKDYASMMMTLEEAKKIRPNLQACKKCQK